VRGPWSVLPPLVEGCFVFWLVALLGRVSLPAWECWVGYGL